MHKLIYRDATGDVRLEVHPAFINVIHCTCKKWSKSVAVHYMYVLDHIIKNYNLHPLYCGRLVDDTKLKHFAEMYGFVDTVYETIDSEGDRRVMMKYLNQDYAYE